MAFATLAVQSHCLCFNEKNLKSAIYFEAERGYRDAVGWNMRFSSFLQSKLSKLCSQANHKFTRKLLEEVKDYGTASISDRTKILNKVSVLMGYNSIQDLLESKSAQGELGTGPKDGMDDFDVSVNEELSASWKDLMDEFNFSLSCRRFSSIILDRSLPILLYDDSKCQSEESNVLPAESFQGDLPNSTDSKSMKVESPSELQRSGDSPVDGVPSRFVEMSSNILSSSVQLIASETEMNSSPNDTAEDSFLTVAPVPQNAASIELILDKPLSSIPGITSKQCRQLEKCGFYTLRKLLHHFPRTYADLQNAHSEIDDGQYLISAGKILSSRGVRTRSSFSFLEIVVSCNIANDGLCSGEGIDTGANRTIYLHLKKFFSGIRFTNQYFLRSLQLKHKEGDLVCVSGKVKVMNKKDHFELREYNIDVIEDEKDSCYEGRGRPYPLYPSKGGLKPHFLRETILRVLERLPINIDPIPEVICQEFDLLSLRNAYLGIHNPKDSNEADLARKRLIFDDFFYLQLGRLFQMLEPLGTQIERDGLLDNYRKHNESDIIIEEWSSLTRKLLEALPYALTSSQLKAVSEIIMDLKRPVPMNRLLQGDVGCGKTVVAFLACMEVVGSGYQAALMVPTELLALQHYDDLMKLIHNIEESCRPNIALLTGSTPTRQSRLICQGLQSGDISLVIGTHRLISETVEFSALRIAVVDEQHRFGVIQRGKFNSKLYSSGSLRIHNENTDRSSRDYVLMAPHVLTMSATPIPRTLALALYGDMSLTQITELPPGRKPIETCIFEGKNTGLESAYQMIREELLSEGKVYIVYPIIELSEQLPELRAASSDLEIVSREFEGYHCGLLHGKMKSDEKDEVLRKFRSGEINILLSTQVIEIGVDVPDATMMVVMNAERFGIAQLHQLRGRVGRGMRKSKCILIVSSPGGLNRLRVLEKSWDGFHLAKVDLLLRGPGDLLGKKQSGHIPEFPIARLEFDGNLLEEAHLAALKILAISHDLEQFPMLKAELSMRQPLCLLGD